MGSAVDACFLAAQTDGLLLVIALGQTPHSGLLAVLQTIQRYRLPLLGAIARQESAETLPPLDSLLGGHLVCENPTLCEDSTEINPVAVDSEVSAYNGTGEMGSSAALGSALPSSLDLSTPP